MGDDRLRGLRRLMASSGLRRGEACGLRWQDVDMEGGRLSVRRALIVVGTEIVVSEPKTARGRRTVSFDPATTAALKSQAARQGDDAQRHGEAWVDSGLVFTQETGESPHPDRVSDAFRDAVVAAGLPLIRLHDLRHTHASLGLAAGIPAKVMSERLGHSTVSITLDTYSHVLPGMQEDAGLKIAALFA
jgi:integrase